jgi:hypothetical protein
MSLVGTNRPNEDVRITVALGGITDMLRTSWGGRVRPVCDIRWSEMPQRSVLPRNRDVLSYEWERRSGNQLLLYRLWEEAQEEAPCST